MNPLLKFAVLVGLLATSLVAVAEEGATTRPGEAAVPATAPAAGEEPIAKKALTASDFKITYSRIMLQCETDLETGQIHTTGPALLECAITPSVAITSGSVEPLISSIVDDAGHTEIFTPPAIPNPKGANTVTNFFNRDGGLNSYSFRITLLRVPSPPRMISEVRGELIVKAALTSKPFVFALEKEGESIAIDKTSSVKLRAVSRDGKKIGVGISFDGVTKSIYDKTSPPYLVRVVLLDKDGKALDAAARRTVVPSMTEAVYTFECPNANDKVSLRVEMVTDAQELRIPVELKLKSGKK